MLQVQPLHVAGTSEREEVREEIIYRNATAYKKVDMLTIDQLSCLVVKKVIC